MATATLDPSTPTSLTAADLSDLFGAIPLSRIRMDPAPGTASERDVVDIHDHEDRLFELVDGILVQKAMGMFESYVTVRLLRILSGFVEDNRLGIVLGPDGMMRLFPGLVRIPDISYISLDRLPNRRVPRVAMSKVAPDLAVEVISPSNTPREMSRKLREYFDAGVRLVWYVYPDPREVWVYTSPTRRTIVRANQKLTGGKVLPGFSVAVRELFAEPGDSRRNGR